MAGVLTSVVGSAGGLLVRTAWATSTTNPEDALVRVCLAALVVVLVWGWVQAVAGVVDAWRATSPSSGGVRRVAALVCGVALAGSLATPDLARADRPAPDPLAGLPLPDRAEGGAHPQPPHLVVRQGDTLWRLAARELGPRATAQQIATRWHRIYAVNRSVIGSDPDLIRPGQVLRLWKEQS